MKYSPDDIEYYKRLLVNSLREVVSQNLGDAMLLSSGLDTAILAYLMSEYVKFKAITVSYKDYSLDLKYARLLAKHLNIKHYVKTFGDDEALAAAKDVVRILCTFDPVEIRNDIPIYIGLKYAKELGCKSIVTGDGGDELFAGYTFLYNYKPKDIDNWVKDIVEKWNFSSRVLGKSLNLNIIQPYTDPKVVEVALSIPGELKVNKYKGRTYGKWILRKAFENYLPRDIVWRSKMPIEVGSGSTRLSRVFMVDEEEYKELSRNVKLRNPEHAFYYKLFIRIFKEIPRPKDDERSCPYCGGGVKKDLRYCRYCGAYPV